MEILLEAFADQLRGTSVTDDRAILMKYGPQLNKILSERTANIVEIVKKDGAEFVTNFLDCTEEAIKTNSGRILFHG